MFKTMDPEVIRQLIAQERDVITPAAKAESELFQHVQCPMCGTQGADKVMLPPKIVSGSDGQPQVARAPFSATSPLVLGHAKCKVCATEYSPWTGVIIKSTGPSVIQFQKQHMGVTDE